MALVTGIFPSCDPADIEKALASIPNVDMASVKVITKSTGGSPAEENSPLNFISVSRAQDDNSLSDGMTRGTGIMSGSGGTSVPGLSGRNANLGDFSGHGHAANYLANLGLGNDLAENYNSAIEDGRCVVLLQGDAATVETLRSAGFRNVRLS